MPGFASARSNCATSGNATSLDGGTTTVMPTGAAWSMRSPAGSDGTCVNASGCAGTTATDGARRWSASRLGVRGRALGVAGCRRGHLVHGGPRRRQPSAENRHPQSLRACSSVDARGLSPLGSTAGCGKPQVQWCGRVTGAIPSPRPDRPVITFDGYITQVPLGWGGE